MKILILLFILISLSGCESFPHIEGSLGINILNGMVNITPSIQIGEENGDARSDETSANDQIQ
jgi:hypothetical protein